MNPYSFDILSYRFILFNIKKKKRLFSYKVSILSKSCDFFNFRYIFIIDFLSNLIHETFITLSFSCGMRHPARQLLQHHHPCSERHLLRLQGGGQLSARLSHGGTPSAQLPGQRTVEQRPAALHQAGAIHTANGSAHGARVGGHAATLPAQGRGVQLQLELDHQPYAIPTSRVHGQQRRQQLQHSGHIPEPQTHASGDQRRV